MPKPNHRTRPRFGLRRSAWPARPATRSARSPRDLGISNESLRRWVIQPIDHGDAPGLTTDERAELVRLRSENRTLRIEREILKQAAAFVARGTDETR